MKKFRHSTLGRYLTVLAILAALGQGRLEFHAPEHSLSAFGAPEAVAACADGLEGQHFEARRFVRNPPCPACLLACSGLGTIQPSTSAPARLVPKTRMDGEARLGRLSPPGHSIASRGPPPLFLSA